MPPDNSGQEEFLAYLKKAGVKVDRETYIECAWGEPLPEWTAELEAELPEELQDWSLFKVDGAELVYTNKSVKDFNPYHVTKGEHGGQFTSGGGGGGEYEELGSMALGGEDRFMTPSTRKVDALRDKMGVANIPFKQRQALDMYTADSTAFNQHARGGSGAVSPETEHLDKLVDSYALPHDVTVYRTVGWQRTQNFIQNVGGVFSDPGFMSTTLDKSKTDKPGSYIEIQVPRGSKAFPVGSMSNFPEEAEVLFPRNSKIQIISHEPRAAANTGRFIARLVP